jgi:hypothetical protein
MIGKLLSYVSVSQDGEKFLITLLASRQRRPTGLASPITVVLNWEADFKK